MKKTALLMLCAGLGLSAQAGALPVNNSGYQGNVGYGAPAAASDNAMFEVLARLEQLQLEVQQLRGMVEEQAQTIADLERKQSNMYSDLDDRMQMLSGPAQPASAGAATETPAVAAATAAAANPPTESAVSGSNAQAVVTPVPAVQETGAEAKTATEVAEASATGKASEKERYQQAYETLRNGHNAQAIHMFESLYSDYPAGEFGDNTQYWLGEAYKINREYDKAKRAFNKVLEQYPSSPKVADALLKLGYIELELQNPAKARDYLTRITSAYPDTTAAYLANKKLAQLPQ